MVRRKSEALDEENEEPCVIRRVIKKIDQVNVTGDDVDVDVDAEDVTQQPARTRRQVTLDTVESAFSELTLFIEAEIERQRDIKKRNGTGNGIKFLQSSLKKTKQLQIDVRKIARKKRAPSRNGNNSGFMKPVEISNELAAFFDMDSGELLSRVECTKKINGYIRDNGLQNPHNRKEILPNKELKKLLKYENDMGPMYYYTIQKLIQPHFKKSAST